MKRVIMPLAVWVLMSCGAQAVEENFTAAEGYVDGAGLNAHPNWLAQSQWTNNNSGGVDGVTQTENGNFIRANYVNYQSGNVVGELIQVNATFNMIGDFVTNTPPHTAAFRELIFALDITDQLGASTPGGEMTAGLFLDGQTTNLELRVDVVGGGAFDTVAVIGPAADYDGHVWDLAVSYTKVSETEYFVDASIDSQQDAAGPITSTNTVTADAVLSAATSVQANMRVLPAGSQVLSGGNPGSYNGVQVDRFEVFDPTDPKLVQLGGGFNFGTIFHETATDSTDITVTYENQGIVEPAIIESVSITNDAGGIYTLVSAPTSGTVVAVGETFDVTVAATGGGGLASFEGVLSIDVSHSGPVGNDQDRLDPLTAVISTTGDAFVLLDNWTLDGTLESWGGNAEPTDGLISVSGARIPGAGDDRALPSNVVASTLQQAFTTPDLSNFDLEVAVVIPEFDGFTPFAPSDQYDDRSFNMAIMSDGALPGTDPYSDVHGSNTLINLLYCPGGAGFSSTPGFYVYDSSIANFQLLSGLGTMDGSTNYNADGTPPTSPNVHRLKIEGRNFGTPSASYTVRMTDANSTNYTRSSGPHTWYRGADLTARTAYAVLFTTNDEETSETNSGSGSLYALQPSFWVDDVFANIPGVTLPAAFFSVDPVPGAPKVIPGGSKTSFTVNSTGFGGSMDVTSISFNDPDLSLESPSLPVSIPAGSSVPFVVKAADMASTGLHADTVTLLTNDPISSNQTVAVKLNVFESGSFTFIDYDDGMANGIHEASINNGGFEDDAIGTSIADATAWRTKTGNNTLPQSTEQLIFGGVDGVAVPTGSNQARTAGWSGGGQLIPVQEFSPDQWTLEDGDYFTLEFKWKASTNFATGVDSLNAVLFGQNADGTVVNPVADRPIQLDNSTTQTTMYNLVAFTNTPLASDAAVLGLGFRFLLEVAIPGDHIAFLDDVTLVGHFSTSTVNDQPLMSSFNFESGTLGVTLIWSDEGGTYKVQASDDTSWSSPTDIPLDGSEVVTNGTIEFQFNDAGATGSERYWRISE